MQKLLLSLATVALLALSPLASAPARAMPLPAAGSIKGAIEAIDITESVRCWRVRRCGPYGCVWRRVCSAPRYYSYRAYPRYAYPYGFVRPYWGYRSHRGYRRWRY